MNPQTPARSVDYQRGFTYLAILFAIVFLGIGLVAVSEVWTTASQRDKEEELLYVGREIRNAIGRYYEASPAGNKRYPPSLEDLLKDSRFPTIKRHLRQIYRDPLTNEATWGLIAAPTGGIRGVHSLSDKEPIKLAGFDSDEEAFAGKKKYADWMFIFAPPSTSSDRELSPSAGQPVRR